MSQLPIPHDPFDIDLPSPLPADVEKRLADMRAWERPRLLKLINSGLHDMAKGLLDVGLALRVLEEQGADYSHVRATPIAVARLVGYGLLCPGVWVHYAAKNPRVYKELAKMPVEDQRKLVKIGAVRLFRKTPDGKPDSSMKALDELGKRDASEISQVFDNGRLRTDDEQLAMLATKDAEPDDEDVLSTVKVKVTARQLRKLRARAKKEKTPVSELLIKAASLAGYLV